MSLVNSAGKEIFDSNCVVCTHAHARTQSTVCCQSMLRYAKEQHIQHKTLSKIRDLVSTQQVSHSEITHEQHTTDVCAMAAVVRLARVHIQFSSVPNDNLCVLSELILILLHYTARQALRTCHCGSAAAATAHDVVGMNESLCMRSCCWCAWVAHR